MQNYKLTEMEIEELYDLAIQTVNKRNIQLKNFLQNGEQIVITNAQYMETYDVILKTSDAGAHPVDNKTKKNPVDMEEKLFQHFTTLITEYLEKDYHKCKDIEDEEEFVEEVKKQYKCFKMYLHWMWKVFQYLDRFYMKNKQSNLKIEAFKIYKVLYWEKLHDKIFNAIIKFQFELLRNDCMIPKSTIQTLIQIYSFLGFQKSFDMKKDEDDTYNLRIPDERGMYILVKEEECKDYYDKMFQQKFAQEVDKFYTAKANIWMNLSTPEYVNEVLKALKKEKEIADYFYPLSKSAIISIIEEIAIVKNAENIAYNPSTGVLYMLQNDKEQQLKDIYTLFSHSTQVQATLKFIALKFQDYLIQHGKRYGQEADAQKADKKSQKDIAIDYISKVQQLRKKSEYLMTNIFNDDLVLQSARDKSFQSFLNEYEKATFYLAFHSDVLLKSDQNYTETEMEEQLQNILKIFLSLFQRDAFFKHYQKFLSNRLLNSTSKNYGAEQDIISKFKAEAGQTSVSKIVTMLQDIKISTELMQEHGQTLKQASKIDLQVNILTSGCWPLSNAQTNKEKSEQQIIPQMLRKATDQFEKLYLKQHQGRYLFWLYSQGTSEIMFNALDDKDKSKNIRYTLIANSYQLLILLLLDEQNGSSSFANLLNQTQIPKDDLDFNLQPLFKLKILTRQKKDGPVQESEQISVNGNFSNKQRKVKIIPGGKADRNRQDKEQAANQEKWNKEIEQEREYVIDACIVRIMKGKRELMFNQLIPECINLITNFKAEIPVIKRRIESLIDRDYLRRESNNINKLIYVP